MVSSIPWISLPCLYRVSARLYDRVRQPFLTGGEEGLDSERADEPAGSAEDDPLASIGIDRQTFFSLILRDAASHVARHSSGDFSKFSANVAGD